MKTKSKTKVTAKFMILIMTMVFLLSSAIPVGAAGSPAEYDPDAVTYRNVMYYGDWTIWGESFYPTEIPADQITHLNFAFLDFDENANLVFTDTDAALSTSLGVPGVTWGEANAGILSVLQHVRAMNPNLRIGVSVGGWTRSGDFSVVAANPVLRAKLVNNIVKFVKYNDMDFADIDWEYPGSVRAPESDTDEGTLHSTPADKANYILFLQELRAALDAMGEELDRVYELSVAIPASAAQLNTSINIPALFEVVDFANIMTYDMAGTWNPISGHHTALYTNPNDPYASSGFSVHDSVTYLLDNGAIASKINVGCAFYTRGFPNVADDGGVPGLPGLYGTNTPSGNFLNAGNWSYGKFDQLYAAYPGLEYYWDSAAHAPYLYDQSTGAFFSFDDVHSVTDKAEYVKEHNLGGVISWQQSDDRATVAGSDVRDELTRALKEGLFGSADLTDYALSNANMDVSVSIDEFSANNQNGFTITITNNAVLNETDQVLAAVEAKAKTVKLPKVYILSASGATFSTAPQSPTVSNENGYGVVDVAALYASRFVPPNSSMSFQVLTNGATDVSDIQSIELAQRISTAGPEISRQVVYGGGTPVDAKPVISGADDVTIELGTAFNARQGVTASDREDGDLTASIQVNGTVDIDTEGVYTLTYSVSDSALQTTTVTRDVTVAEEADVVNTPPVIAGATNKTVNIGDSFDPLLGVSASDAEDGVLTSAIVVTGSVDTSVPGSYNLSYAVTDSDGATTTASCVITVVPTDSDEYDPNKVYVAGDTAVYNGVTYKAKWWIQGGGTPDVNQAWERVDGGGEEAGDIEEYNPSKVYVGGDQVTYQGNTYEAQWWTQGDIPGSNSVWVLVE